MNSSFLIVGGAGFIGSSFLDVILSGEGVRDVTLIDNFSSGRLWHIDKHLRDPRLKIIAHDIQDLAGLNFSGATPEVVIHLASNPDISKAEIDPDLDFRNGTVLTRNVLEFSRKLGVKKFLYVSGSGVYGSSDKKNLLESDATLSPVSPYGASKIAGEALCSAYMSMFGISVVVARFCNIVGRRQTHGVLLDFICKLKRDSQRLEILGDGRQSKSYLLVEDAVKGCLMALNQVGLENFDTSGPQVYNISNHDVISVMRIGEIVIAEMGLDSENVKVTFTGGSTGWRGDVPSILISADRIRGLGWSPSLNSEGSIVSAAREILREFDGGSRIQNSK